MIRMVAVLVRLFAIGFFLAGCATAPQTEVPPEGRLTAGIFLEPEPRGELPPGTALRKVYEKGLELTKASEGWVPRLYNDAAGYCTIGYGHLVKLARCDETEPPEFRRGLTIEEGTRLLVADMARAERAVMLAVDVDLTDGQFAALADFVFNVGASKFERSTLRKVVNAREYDRVPGQLSRWAYAGNPPVALKGLLVRRGRETDLFFDGLPRPRGAPPDEDLTPIDIRHGE